MTADSSVITRSFNHFSYEHDSLLQRGHCHRTKFASICIHSSKVRIRIVTSNISSLTFSHLMAVEPAVHAVHHLYNYHMIGGAISKASGNTQVASENELQNIGIKIHRPRTPNYLLECSSNQRQSYIMLDKGKKTLRIIFHSSMSSSSSNSSSKES